MESEEGIYMITKMLDRDYFAIEAVNHSKLMRLMGCPAAMQIPVSQTPQMLLGSLAHCLILEGREEYNKRFAVAPECDRRTKAGKELWEEFTLCNPDKTVITLEQLETVSSMAKSVASHPSARELLSSYGEAEMAITWKQPVNKLVTLDCKAKADWMNNYCLIDLKTCSDASYCKFSKTIFNNYYHVQLAYYRLGLNANAIFPDRFIIIAVENKAPFTCEVYEIPDEVLDFGEGTSRELLERYASLDFTQELKTYNYAGIHQVRIPTWLTEL